MGDHMSVLKNRWWMIGALAGSLALAGCGEAQQADETPADETAAEVADTLEATADDAGEAIQETADEVVEDTEEVIADAGDAVEDAVSDATDAIVGPALVYSVDSLSTNLRGTTTEEGWVITATGTVTTSGWTDPQLVEIGLGDDGYLDYEFVATPPAEGDVVAEVLTQVTAEVTLNPVPEGAEVLRVTAETNQQEMALTTEGMMEETGDAIEEAAGDAVDAVEGAVDSAADAVGGTIDAVTGSGDEEATEEGAGEEPQQ